jgi:hypothetical protein
MEVRGERWKRGGGLRQDGGGGERKRAWCEEEGRGCEKRDTVTYASTKGGAKHPAPKQVVQGAVPG